MDIQINWNRIHKQILDFQKKSHSNIKSNVLAVSKMQSVEKIKELFELGQKYFGENYVQEFLEKKKALSHLQIEWHFIGHIQSKKTKDIVGECELIHSIDSVKLIEKIEKICQEKSLTEQKILLQVNMGDEDSKTGFHEKDLFLLPKEIWQLPRVHIVGLMTLPPLQNQPEENRQYFRRLKEIRDTLNEKLPINRQLVELSMGTSHDFPIALEEGATYIRLGTVLFGERTTL